MLVFRRLLFTDESLLPHELGQGQAAFRRHKCSLDSSTSKSVKHFSGGEDEEGEGVEQRDGGEGEGGEGVEQRSGEGEGGEVDASLRTLSQENTGSGGPSSFVANEHISSEPSNQETAAEGTVKGGSPTSPHPLTSDELARVRAQVASLATHSSPLTPHTCSSYFIEPVQWMEPTLLGHVEGKVRACYSELTNLAMLHPCILVKQIKLAFPVEVMGYCHLIGQILITILQECIRTGSRVRACNSVKFETSRNLPPVLKIIVPDVLLDIKAIVAKHVIKCSIFSTVQ